MRTGRGKQKPLGGEDRVALALSRRSDCQSAADQALARQRLLALKSPQVKASIAALLQSMRAHTGEVK